MTSGHVFLVGFMGAGKSTVARTLAARMELLSVDLDARIEARAGRSIAQIFSANGEERFRQLETEALESLRLTTPSVVATGGGVVLSAHNRTLLGELGTVVYLEVTAEEALARIADLSSRPLLAGSGGALAATALLSGREGLYRSVADLVVSTVGLDAEAVAGEVERGLREANS